MPLVEVLIIFNPYQKKNGSCLEYVTLLGKWINNGIKYILILLSFVTVSQWPQGRDIQYCKSYELDLQRFVLLMMRLSSSTIT